MEEGGSLVEPAARGRPRPPQGQNPPGIGHNRPPRSTPPQANPTPTEPPPPYRRIDPERATELYRRLQGTPERDSPLNTDTVAFTQVDGKEVFGVNSQAPGYTREDRAAADQMRASLIEKYPEIMKSENIGWKPNDALYHAEATALMRAAREAGSLGGRTIEVHVDRLMCPSCDRVLPLLSSEIGHPTIVFIGPRGERAVMQRGEWIE